MKIKFLNERHKDGSLRCRWCGAILNESNVTRDHTPSKCYYERDILKTPTNLKTVPCCIECNQSCGRLTSEIFALITFENSGSENIDYERKLLKKLGSHFLEWKY